MSERIAIKGSLVLISPNPEVPEHMRELLKAFDEYVEQQREKHRESGEPKAPASAAQAATDAIKRASSENHSAEVLGQIVADAVIQWMDENEPSMGDLLTLAEKAETDRLSQCEQAAEWQARAKNAEARIKRLIEALTPSANTKAAYIGEFKFSTTYVSEDGEEVALAQFVPWTTINEIMKAILTRAAIAATEKDAADV